MDAINKIAFYSALTIGTPVIILSYRCIFILARKEYRKNAFCRIFIASLVSNSIAFVLLMHIIRFASQGLFPEHYESIKNAPWLSGYSWVTRIFYLLSLMLSFVLSVNRVTSLYLPERLSEKIWRHFFVTWLPILTIISAAINLESLLNRAEYVQGTNPDGSKFYQLINNIKGKWDSYYMLVECAADLLCNAIIILKFIKIRMGSAKRTAFENSLYLVGFTSFVTHTATTGMQIILHYRLIPKEYISWGYLVGNMFLDISIIFPSIAILVLTKEIRRDVKRAFYRLARCCCPNDKRVDTTMTVIPSGVSTTTF